MIAEALLSLQSHFVPRLPWLITQARKLGCMKRPYSSWHGLVWLLPAAAFLSELPAVSLQLWLGFSTFVPRKAVVSFPMAWISL